MVGTGIVANPTDPMSYAVKIAGINVGPLPHSAATVSRNAVTNAAKGIEGVNAAVTGSDNAIDLVYTGISGVQDVGAATGITINRSDITRYIVPLAGVGLTDLTCNWWGLATGPLNVATSIATSIYTAWAVAPIANGAGGGCTGAPSALPLQLACSLEPTLHSVDGAVSTSIQFVNQTAGPVTVSWLNYQGQRVFYNTLAAGQSYVQQTFVTHPWIVTDASGVCLGIWLPTASLGVALIGG